MFEKDTEWKAFRRLFTDTQLTPDDICRTTQISRIVVNGYADQYNGKKVLESGMTTIPTRLQKFAVGFRYMHLNRWMQTADEMFARSDYDAGLNELAQGKYKVNGSDAYVLFAIPRKRPVKNRRLYFTAQVWA